MHLRHILLGILTLLLVGALVWIVRAPVRTISEMPPSLTLPMLPRLRTLSAPTPASPAVFASIPYWDQPRAVASFKEHAALIDHVSLFWYYLAPDGSVRRYAAAQEDASIIDFAHAQGVNVFALVANLPDTLAEEEEWDSDRIDLVIADPAAREAHIQALVRLAVEGNFDGINIDYEALERYQREDFTVFIAGLGEALHVADKLLGVALHPKTSEGDPREANGSQAQDWAALHESADQLYFMTYGEHDGSTAPGPIASPQWMERVLAHARERGVPPEKIFLGMPLYAEEWRRQGGRVEGVDSDLLWHDVQTLAQQAASEVRLDPASQTPSLTQSIGGQEREIWYENAASVQAKLNAARQYGVTRVALWRLGGEDPAVWDVLEALRPSAPG